MNTLTIVTLLVLVLLILGLIMPLRLSWRSKAILTVVTIVGMSRNYIYLVVGGNSFDPNIPYNLYFVLDLTRATLITLALLVLARQILNLIAKLVKRQAKAFVIPAFSLFHAQLMLLIAFAIACYGTSCAYSKPRINHYQVTLERLDPRLDGMRVIMISDFHISALSDPSYVADIVNKINGLNPDLILLPGDLIDGQVNKRDALTKLLFELKAKFGVYLTTGNHEYYSGYQQWHEYFVKGGLISLDNRVIALKDDKNKTLLTLGGLTDPKAALYNLPMPDVQGVVAALDDSAPTIILSHRPAYAVDLAHSGKKVDLVLSGHTHGGLIVGFNQLVSKLNNGFLSGHYRIKNTDLIVSNGLAVWSGYPMRIGVPNEFIVMTLRSKVRPQDMSNNITYRADLRRELIAKKQQQEAQQAKAKGVMNLTASTAGAAPTSTELTPEASQDINDPNSIAQDNESPKAFSEIKTKKGSVQGLNLILPMVDTESGKTYQSIAHLALLPEELSPDQIKRINEILREPKDGKKASAHKENKPQAASLVPSFTLPKGIKLEILKSGPNEENDKVLTAPPVRTEGIATKGRLNLVPKGPASQAQAKGIAPVQSSAGGPLSTEELMAKEQASQDITAEIQSEYAISLGNSQDKLDDKQVSDLLKK